MIPASEALDRLREGNHRFVTGTGLGAQRVDLSKRAELVDEQRPFAVIFGCSDSRVPAEIVFDQGLGDLFVIRVAGHVVAPSLVGSVEFAASRFDTRLVVVLGHSGCGAVRATLESLLEPTPSASPNLLSIVDRIRPAVADLVADGHPHDVGSTMAAAVRANVAATVEHLSRGSEILEGLVRHGGLSIVGAEYSLETGVVDFLDQEI